MEQGYAESTIDATIWLICYRPAELKEWLDRHPPGERLERIARARIQAKREARAAGAKPPG